MRARDEIRLIIAALFMIQVVLAFSAIGLLTRIKPAVEEILVENVASIEAVEDMLVVLATPPAQRDAASQQTFQTALERARTNITEEGERPVVETLVAQSSGALAGDPAAYQATVAALGRLGDINVASMKEADQRAKQLGTAGAWIAAFLGGLGFVLSVLAVRRLTRRFLTPLNELAETVEAYRQGDLHRRFSTADAPLELARVGETVNGLILDQLGHETPQSTHVAVDRAALLFFLDTLERPAFVLEPGGAVVASNSAGADHLRTDAGRTLLDALRADPDAPPAGVSARSMRGAAWLVELTPPGA